MVDELIKKNGVVALKADWTDGSPEIKKTLKKYGSNTLPFVLVFPANDPSNPIILRDLITKGDVLKALQEAGPSKHTNTVTNVRHGEPASANP